MPFTLFCHLNTSDDAFTFFDDRNAVIEGDKDNWSATYVFPGKFLQKKKAITFNFDRDWCSPPNWPNQINGMIEFFGNFHMEDDTRSRVINLISEFKFAIGIVNEPELEKDDDPRLEVMHAIAEHMQGSFFTPGAMLDSSFRAFAAADGDTTPGAVIQKISGEMLNDERDEDNEPPPPTADRVAKRMYVMLAIVARGLLDMNLQQGNEPAYSLKELHDWFNALDIADELELHEKEILYTDVLKLDQQDCINSIWSVESLVVIAWSLGLTALPNYDQMVEVDVLLNDLSFLDVDACLENIAKVSLRDLNELEQYYDQIFSYDWRMVDFRVNPAKIDYASVQIGQNKFDLSWANLLEGDLAIQGTRIDEVDQDLMGMMGSIAVERHKASNWLQGFAELYSEISPDT